MLFELPRDFPSRYGAPVVRVVDTTIFLKQYFGVCLECGFCRDLCCSYGVDVDLLHKQNIEERADAIEAYVGVSRDRWFQSTIIEDDELPGGGSVRTQVVDGACVFLNRSGRGCLLHSFCNEMGLDYHDYKSIVDCLFPLVVSDQTLVPADEVDDATLVCSGQGPTLYEALRGEVDFYFGPALIERLDALGREAKSGSTTTA